MRHAAERAAAVMRAWLTTLVGLSRGPIVVANNADPQGIGGRNTGSPAGRDRRKNLHRQGKQDDRKEFPQPPAHQTIHLFDAAN
jgi:hypothetical protein